MTDEELHKYAREYVASNPKADFDKRLLRYNDIVTAAKRFYATAIKSGIRECIDSCIKDHEMYVPKNSLPDSLTSNYSWLLRY